MIKGYRRQFPADDYNHNSTSSPQTNIHVNECVKHEIAEGLTNLLDDGQANNASNPKENDIKSQTGSCVLDSTAMFSGNRASRNQVSDEPQHYTNYPSNGMSLQGHHQTPLSVSVSASNSPFVNKRMGSKQTLLQVISYKKLCF